MSTPADFLGRLAARALGQAPPLAPRPAAPFEGSVGIAEEAVEAAPSRLPDFPRPAPADHPESPSRQDRHHAPEGTAPKGRTLNSLGLQPQVSDPYGPLRPEGAVPFDLRAEERHRPLGADPVGEGRFLGLKPQAIQSPPLRGGVVLGDHRHGDGSGGGLGGGSTDGSTEGKAEFSAFDGERTLAGRIEPAAARPRTVDLAGPVRSGLTPRTTLHDPSLSLAALVPAHATAAPEPVIRVTIGRIEVRAVTPAAPSAPAPRAAAPRLGLAEYLRRRGEGRP